MQLPFTEILKIGWIEDKIKSLSKKVYIIRPKTSISRFLDEYIINAKHCIDARSSLIRRFAPYIKSQKDTRRGVMIYSPKGLMIYERISRRMRVIHSMIYQVCDLDKKILQKMYHFLQYFL